jgi:hypothetical protein
LRQRLQRDGGHQLDHRGGPSGVDDLGFDGHDPDDVEFDIVDQLHYFDDINDVHQRRRRRGVPARRHQRIVRWVVRGLRAG